MGSVWQWSGNGLVMQNPERATCTFANLEALGLAILLFSVNLHWCADCSIGQLAKEEGGISGGQKREGEESKQERNQEKEEKREEKEQKGTILGYQPHGSDETSWRENCCC